MRVKSVACLATSLVIVVLLIVTMYDYQWSKRLVFDDNNTEQFKEIDDTLAELVKHNVRLVCWVNTHPKNHATRAITVKETWGKRCNTLLFMSTDEDPVLNTIVLPVKPVRSTLWAKVKLAFSHIYEHHLNELDWVLKADDDTYVVVENLRYMLSAYSPDERWIFGCKFRYASKTVYMSGGAGYVLSRSALVQFVEMGIYSNVCEDFDAENEDVDIGICMSKLNVTMGNSLDETGAKRFLPLHPMFHLIPSNLGADHWYWQYRFDGTPDVRIDNCSSHIISFHYVTPNEMKVFDYFLYDVHVYGRTRNSKPLRIE